MEQYKKDFIDFMVRCGVLTFGDFTTKSGRKTPFFINTGKYDTGEQIARLGGYYAQALMERLGGEVDCLFGPAYKGIPLATAAAMAMATTYQKNVTFCFNRKEAKDHGEGGTLIGHKLRDGERIAIIEDVTTAGTSVRESVPMLKAAADVRVAALVVSVDRMEKGAGERSALVELQEEFGLVPVPIVTLDEIVEHLEDTPVDGILIITPELRTRIDAYRAQYGAK